MWTAEHEAEWVAACAGGDDLSPTDRSSALGLDGAAPITFSENRHGPATAKRREYLGS
jgi:hypothetical protein